LKATLDAGPDLAEVFADVLELLAQLADPEDHGCGLSTGGDDDCDAFGAHTTPILEHEVRQEIVHNSVDNLWKTCA
jgi:hypothetical protein